MVIDSSALIAILLGEPETRDFSIAIEGDSTRLSLHHLFSSAICASTR